MIFLKDFEKKVFNHFKIINFILYLKNVNNL
jgi:hypothetical protein